MSASLSQNELVAPKGTDDDVFRTVQWLQERVKRLKISEDAKNSLVSQLEWVSSKFRDVVGSGAADFVNDQLRRICDFVDVIAPSAPPALSNEAEETSLPQEFEAGSAGEDENADQWDPEAACEQDGGQWDPEPVREQSDTRSPRSFPPLDSTASDHGHPSPSHADRKSNLHFQSEREQNRAHNLVTSQPTQERRIVHARSNTKHSKASDWMQQDFTPPPMTFTAPDETAAPGPYDMQPHTAGRYYRPPPQYDYRALVPLQPDDHPDVHLNIPNLSVGLIDFEIDQIQARVALEADVRDVVHIFAGVDARIGRVKLTIEDVQATVQLTARLDNVRKILERGLDTVDGVAKPTLSRLLGGK